MIRTTSTDILPTPPYFPHPPLPQLEQGKNQLVNERVAEQIIDTIF